MASSARSQVDRAAINGVGYSFRSDTGGKAKSPFKVLADQDCGGSLGALIEREIIPRLIVAHAADAPAMALAGTAETIAPAEIEQLVQLALEVDADVVLEHVEAILKRGATVETVMVDLLAPAARILGDFWDDDRCDAVDVAMGLWRLKEVVHEIATPAPGDRALAAGGHRALFASMPGDPHGLGTVVMDEMFRMSGWMTDRLSDAQESEIVKRAGDNWFDIIGLTISCDCHIAPATSVIAALRNVSRNPRVCVMVGGRIFEADPAFAAHVGADGTARDAKLALRVATDFVRSRDAEAAVCC